jgi:ribonuclease P protein component
MCPKKTQSSDYAFPKSEKLTSLNAIQAVFRSGQGSFSYPFKITFLGKQNSLPQILISVPKRNFKKAVDRNRLKRLIRECYRLTIRPFYLNQEGPFPAAISIHFAGKEILSFDVLKKKLILAFQQTFPETNFNQEA